MTRILVLYHSLYGHIETMAEAAAAGVRETGAEAVIKRVPETIPDAVMRNKGMRADQPAPIATPNEIGDYDGILLGSGTRFGNMTGQMRNFLDQTGGVWMSGALVGKPGGVFTASSTQHGGQESTLLTMQVTLLHLGMVIVGLPYSAAGQTRMDEITGGSPYGASTITGGDNSRQPSANEIELMRFQGAHLARIATKLKAAP
ncbi:MAG: NAD(P)H:quinone oxidoreductase [Alphaproteobacteria bacterium]|nr:NAD(P)H:quinone oxidoreductase [Alphaproteobacteria bacterium]MBF0394729.1 NAD(P)H:quinone oxidoreductase [Alphaproteobacteria bacterium]